MSDIEEVTNFEDQGALEESAIDLETQENYRKWKSNCVPLYDYLNTVNSVWPSLTTQFFPDKEIDNKKSKYRLLTGTFTSGQRDEYLQLGSFTVKSELEEIDISKYDPDLEEFLTSNPLSGKFNNDQKILHKGDINRARYMPQKPDLIATINNNGEVYIFDKTKHPSQPSEEFKFDIGLMSHKQEGFGLSWNNHNEGQLLTCSSDGDTKLWDITKFKKTDKIIDTPVENYNDESSINDVSWNPQHNSIFANVNDDNKIKIIDTRSNKPTTHNSTAHTGGINALNFSLQSAFTFTTADSNGIINIWDLRTQEPLFTIKGHEGSISSIQFNPNKPHILASGGFDDNLVKLWDLSKPKDDQLMFIHAGHMLGINDLSWNPHDENMLSSVANDNTLHIWKPSQTLFK